MAGRAWLWGLFDRAMALVAGNGHLDVAKCFHKHRAEGCLKAATENAYAENRKVKVVKWLHKYRTKGCTKIAVDLAVRNGHTRVVQLLLANRSEDRSMRATSDTIELFHDAEPVHSLFEYCQELIDTQESERMLKGMRICCVGCSRWEIRVKLMKRCVGERMDGRYFEVFEALGLLDVNTDCEACTCRIAMLFIFVSALMLASPLWSWEPH